MMASVRGIHPLPQSLCAHLPRAASPGQASVPSEAGKGGSPCCSSGQTAPQLGREGGLGAGRVPWLALPGWRDKVLLRGLIEIVGEDEDEG